MMIDQRGDRGGDLGGVGRDGRQHPEQPFREPEPRSDALQPHDEEPADTEADRGPEDEVTD
jgi:hypothetical protein